MPKGERNLTNWRLNGESQSSRGQRGRALILWIGWSIMFSINKEHQIQGLWPPYEAPWLMQIMHQKLVTHSFHNGWTKQFPILPSTISLDIFQTFLPGYFDFFWQREGGFFLVVCFLSPSLSLPCQSPQKSELGSHFILLSRVPWSKAREYDSRTFIQPCMWFLHDGTD